MERRENISYRTMHLIIIFINKTPLYFAVEKGNPDIIQLLLFSPKIYVNERSILRKYHPARCIYPNRKQIILLKSILCNFIYSFINDILI